ncbi:polyketide synthase [Apodospora peruviana]|uniref:Polyketide synthase n=1 Tax=Apodospora peruviana TaxID=516989 RepID=A0AAE0IKQ1_9PEZI|nr:polyketide synthase [Apodospora peruviana]
MVLRDNLFAEMPFADWEAAMGPKVQGIWNLHNALLHADGKLHTPLDLFILMDSTSCILGHQGQANYTAANTFLDSAVQFRHAQGMPASCLDLSVVSDVGYVSERKACSTG